jgi:hypothetical protein
MIRNVLDKQLLARKLIQQGNPVSPYRSIHRAAGALDETEVRYSEGQVYAAIMAEVLPMIETRQ